MNLFVHIKNLNTRTLNNRANDDNLLHDSTAFLYFRYESYSRPTIHPTVTICILKKSTIITPTGRICRIISFADGLNLPLV